MKDYTTSRWVCNECDWEWETLYVVTDDDNKEECPTCSSFDTRESAIAPSAIFTEGFSKN